MDSTSYPEYRDSNVNWLEDIPAHWDVVPIKFSLATPITDGPHETPKLYHKGIPFLSAEAVKEDKLDFSRMRGYISEEEHARFSKKYKPARGDVYMVKSGATTGNVARVETDEEFNIWSPLAAIRPDINHLTTDFIFYFMKSRPFFYSVELSWSYGTQQNIGMGIIANLKMARPPVDEQYKIGSYLNYKTAQIDRLIEKKNALIEELNEQRIAMITQAVTKGLNPDAPMKDSEVDWLGEVPEHWEVLSIKRLTPVKRGASPRPIQDQKYFDDDGEYSWVRIADVTANDHYLVNTYQTLSELGKSLSVPLEPGTLFLSIAGSVGKPMITNIKCCIHDGFVYFPYYEHNPEFLYYIFYSGQPYLGLGKLGTQLNLNTDTVGDIKIGLPSIEEQHEIVDHLHLEMGKLDNMESAIKAAIDQLNEYRTALITAAVTGKIDVRNWKPSND